MDLEGNLMTLNTTIFRKHWKLQLLLSQASHCILVLYNHNDFDETWPSF